MTAPDSEKLLPKRNRHSVKHGMKGTRIYRIWVGMKGRCLYPSSPSYKHYGGRGIKVCERWLSFLGFFEDMGACPEGHEIDRINNDGNYEPGNCRWVTRKQNTRNKSHNRNIEFRGKTQCLADWAREADVSPWGLRWRLRAGWSLERALTTRSRLRAR